MNKIKDNVQPDGSNYLSFLSLKNLFFCISLVLFISACGGGEDSQRDPGGNKQELGDSTATAKDNDVFQFQTHVWKPLRDSDKECGRCHRSQAQTKGKTFFLDDDINRAYDQFIENGLMEKSKDPETNIETVKSSSKLIVRVGPSLKHWCWSTHVDCQEEMTTMLNRMINGYTRGVESRETVLTPIKPENQKALGDSLLFPKELPSSPSGIYDGVHNLLTQYCSNCHRQDGPQQQQLPYFATANKQDSYNAAKVKIDLNNPENSELVQRLKLEHNCWDVCDDDAEEMRLAIIKLAADIKSLGIKLDDENIIISKALVLLEDGVQDTGGNRYEANQIALYEFQNGSGSTAFDSSGIQPSLNLTLFGNEGIDYRWLSNWGIEILTPLGRAQGSTSDSKKLHNRIKLSGQYSIEAWVIPGNVTQMDSNIVSYSFGEEKKNFTLGQNMYNYESYHRSSTTGAGDDALSTPNGDEVLQASLQHVVVTYDSFSGRKIYVNGELINVSEPDDQGGNLLNWDSSFALVLGNDTDTDRPWLGILRMVAIHDAALSQEQVKFNFDAEVGQKYLMPFAVSHIDGMPDESYIVFEVSQYDEFSYLFRAPRYINLGGVAPANFGTVPLKGMRIGMNGDEVAVGQAYSNVDIGNLATSYVEGEGKSLSNIDTIVELQNGSDIDEFFLTFEKLGGDERNQDVAAYDEKDANPTDIPALRTVNNDTMTPRIGVRTFDEINATMAKMLKINDWAGILDINNSNPELNEGKLGTFVQYRQQFPAGESIEGFATSHQMAISQLAITYCKVRIDRDINKTHDIFFTGFDFGQNPSVAFANEAAVDTFIAPLLTEVVNVSETAIELTTQPEVSFIRNEMYKLILHGDTFTNPDDYPTPDSLGHTENINIERVALISAACDGTCTSARTRLIAISACSAVLGSAIMLIQ
ncbi:MAG: LamG domain-containing protein [Gammaproteobacteria bacterium]|nr:LamG domain-containing protein [Gammaproteobacteria bacterium]